MNYFLISYRLFEHEFYHAKVTDLGLKSERIQDEDARWYVFQLINLILVLQFRRKFQDIPDLIMSQSHDIGNNYILLGRSLVLGTETFE